MKGAVEYNQTQYQAEINKIASAIADMVALMARDRGWDQTCAGALAMRAATMLMLQTMPHQTVAKWLQDHAASLEAVPTTPFGRA